MTTYNTGNTLGSSDARDLYDNAENIDNFANGAANTYKDRLGVTRKSIAGMQNAFDDFIESSGYTVPVAYTSGIVLSAYNQLIEYDSEFYKLKAGQAPYTTTGTWGTDSAKLVAVGDAALRQELAGSDGAEKVGYTPAGSGAVATDVQSKLREFDSVGTVDYSAPAYSMTAGTVQTGPLIIDASKYLRITGDSADASYNNEALQDILAGLPYGAEVEFPARGLAYFDGGLLVEAASVSLRGHNSAASYDQFSMRFLNDLVPAFRIKHSGFFASNLMFLGKTSGRALSETQDAFDFDVTLNNGNCDARFHSCGFIWWRSAISITQSSGRNIAARDCSFSNCRHAFALEFDASPTDQRVFEFFDNRYHSIGRLLNADDSVFYIKPTANAVGLVVAGGHVDDSVRVMRGFAGMSELSGIISSRAAGAFADIDATGNTLTGYRQFNIHGCALMNINATTHTFSGIMARGPMALHISGYTSGGTGGHGIEVNCDFSDIRAATIHNASMGSTNTYSGFYVGSLADNTVFGAGCAYKQGREVAAAGTTAKKGVENYGANTCFTDRVLVDNLTGANAYYIDPTKSSRGPDPVVPGVLQRISWGSAAPTTGTWALGDFVENVSSSGSNKGWRCTVGGTPGTWISV